METGRACSIEGCRKKHYARGWCSAHYTRWRRHGDPEGGGERIEDVREAVFARTKRGEGGCLIWTGGQDGKGYGVQRYEGRDQPAHRVVWKLAHGEIPEGYRVNHVCHTPLCVALPHLNLATQSENGTFRSGPPAHNTSGFRNVRWCPYKKTWYVSLMKEGERFQKYGFPSKEIAAKFAEELREEIYGKFAGKG